MKKFLESEEAAFYHITTWSNWESIKKTGLKKGTGKGVSVLRTNDDRIINAVFITQLQSVESLEENRFVLLKLSQNKNRFMPQIIKPDLVDEWTWPFHNNIMKNVHQNYIELEKEFSVENLDEANSKENKDREDIIYSEIFFEALNFKYRDEKGSYSYDIDKKKNYINEQQNTHTIKKGNKTN